MKHKVQNNKEIILSIQIGFLAAGFITDLLVFYFASILIGLFCNLSVSAEKVIAKYWLFFGKAIGLVSQTIILTIVYYFILTPLGLLKRICTKDVYFFHKTPKEGTWKTMNKLYSKKDLLNPW